MLQETFQFPFFLISQRQNVLVIMSKRLKQIDVWLCRVYEDLSEEMLPAVAAALFTRRPASTEQSSSVPPTDIVIPPTFVQ